MKLLNRRFIKNVKSAIENSSFGSQKNLRGLKYSRIKNRTLQFVRGRSILIFLLGANQRRIDRILNGWKDYLLIVVDKGPIILQICRWQMTICFIHTSHLNIVKDPSRDYAQPKRLGKEDLFIKAGPAWCAYYKGSRCPN